MRRGRDPEWVWPVLAVASVPDGVALTVNTPAGPQLATWRQVGPRAGRWELPLDTGWRTCLPAAEVATLPEVPCAVDTAPLRDIGVHWTGLTDVGGALVRQESSDGEPPTIRFQLRDPPTVHLSSSPDAEDRHVARVRATGDAVVVDVPTPGGGVDVLEFRWEDRAAGLGRWRGGPASGSLFVDAAHAHAWPAQPGEDCDRGARTRDVASLPPHPRREGSNPARRIEAAIEARASSFTRCTACARSGEARPTVAASSVATSASSSRPAAASPPSQRERAAAALARDWGSAATALAATPSRRSASAAR